jgi:hypothetical protein
MSGTQGGGAPAAGGDAGGTAPGQAPGQAPGGGQSQAPAAPASTERLSVRDATRTLGERRRDAPAPGAEGEPQGRRRQRTAPGALPPGTPAAPATPGASAPGGANGAAPGADGSQRERGADVLAQLMENLRGTEAPGGADAGGQPGAAAPAGDAADGVTLEVGGKQQTFTRAQLLDHVLKATDYTRKSQQLAEFAREVQQAQATVAELVPILTPMLQQQIAQLEGNLGPEPNWVELARTDPAQYNIKRAEWDMAERERRKLAMLQAQQSQQTEAQQRAKLTEGHKELVKALPGWDDPATRGRIQQEIVKWGRANGYPDGELRALYEPRYVVTLTKAMMFDRMMAGAKTDAPVVPVVQRGALPPAATEPVRNAETQFQEKPSVRNATQLLAARRAAQRGNGRAV